MAYSGGRKTISPGPRMLGTLIMGFCLVVLESTAGTWWSLGPLRLQPSLVMVVSAGFRLPLLGGGLVAFALGYLQDVLTGGFLGLRVTASVAVFLACTLAQRKLEINSWPFQMAAVGLMSLAWQLQIIGGLLLLPREVPGLVLLPLVAVCQALLCALTAPVFFGLLESWVGLCQKIWNQLGGMSR